MNTSMIFAQYKPNAGVAYNLYTVPAGSSAIGTLWVVTQNATDTVRVQIIAATINGVSSPSYSDNRSYILYDTPLRDNVPVYLQQLNLNAGDVIRIYSSGGNSAFTFTGELVN